MLFLGTIKVEIMAKEQGTYRLPGATKAQIQELKDLFGESPSEVIERAVNLLFTNRKEELQKVMQARLEKIQG
jgi:hypothetical protein